jgi:hypothetical protein
VEGDAGKRLTWLKTDLSKLHHYTHATPGCIALQCDRKAATHPGVCQTRSADTGLTTGDSTSSLTEGETLVGEDGKHYIFRVREMRKYLASALRVSPVAVLKDFDTAFANQAGIIAFDVLGWSNASEHLALWNGKPFREPNHDDYRGLEDDPGTPIKEAQTQGMSFSHFFTE